MGSVMTKMARAAAMAPLLAAVLSSTLAEPLCSDAFSRTTAPRAAMAATAVTERMPHQAVLKAVTAGAVATADLLRAVPFIAVAATWSSRIALSKTIA